MGNLRSFADYVTSCRHVVSAAETRLRDLQSRYEAFYQEVSTVREQELAQLAWEINRRRGSLPEGLDAALARAKDRAEKDMDKRLAELTRSHQALVEKAEQTRKTSVDLEAEAHQRNVDLDAQEEALKARNEQLLQGIATYNGRIVEMGTGFGFLLNLPRMRDLQAERLRLDEEHGNVAARIEAVRAQWATREQEYCARQEVLRQEWTDLSTRAATLQAKIDHLVATRATVVVRTALERVLFERYPSTPPQGGPQPCPRCQGGNPPTNRFCQFCAVRLQPDRPDLEGSLPEIAELNYHFRRFSEGMKACQELIALVHGLDCGLQAFAKSVSSMIDNENKYPLSKLRIDVPQQCVEYSRNFEVLRSSVEQKAAHPTELARMVEQATSQFSQKNLQGYFERMGQELSIQAKSQWG